MKKDILVQQLVNSFGNWVRTDCENRAGGTARMTRDLYPYTSLFSPIRINKLTVKNRLVMAPMGNCQMAEETGRPNDKMLQYFFARAEGGVGLLTTGLIPISHHIDSSVTEKGNYSYFPRIDGTRTNFMGWRDLAQGVHARGSRIFIQLTPGLGRVGNPQCLLTKLQLPVSASWNPNFYLPDVPCRPLTDLECDKIIRNADTKLFDELGYDDILWIDMLLPTIKEQKAVENFMEISLQTKQQVEEIESTSKYSENENSIISNSNFFVPTGDSFIVEPVSFIISNEGVLVSVRSAEFRTFRETEKRLQMNYRSYSTGYHLFISLLEVRIDFDADLVELIAKQVAALSKDINSENSIDKEVLHRISALQESTMSLRENIFDRQRVLSGILRSERFPNDIYPRLQLMIKDVNSLINHADFSFQRLDYIQDAALGLINIEQNEIVKIFSVAAVIFMPATLIASIYGMNFKFMPELDWTLTLGNGWNIPLGYIFAIGLMIFCSALTIWYFKYKKWL